MACQSVLISELEQCRHQDNQVALDWAGHWGGGITASISIGLLLMVGEKGSAYVFICWTLFLIPSFYLSRRIEQSFGPFGGLAAYMAMTSIPTTHLLVIVATMLKFLMSKMGTTGCLFLPDVIVAVSFGLSTFIVVGPVMPVLRRWVGHWRVVQCLIFISVIAASISSQVFPYGPHAPKRMGIQNIHFIDNGVVRSGIVVSTFDANTPPFVLKHVPRLAKAIGVEISGEEIPSGSEAAPHTSFLAWYPLGELIHHAFFVRSKAVPPFPGDFKLPSLQVSRVEIVGKESRSGSEELMKGWRRLHVVFDLGSAKQVWVSAINVTGALTKWSITDGQLPG
ncbi:hypothetical protein CBR_g21983 [Chara braunii]|uniref:Uncharacterized protein n=1 Tax=Chara braunii TaxID=69332 RepID=A0A388L1Q0_CHABU|nr:hypothetical protein CBR_g21983 [Chara braunii]|eukprot:GBG76235.1 hypothetical protein CBR_g21983 [Chara braunii]